MKPVTTIFWLLVITFLFILGQFFVPAVRDSSRGSLLFLAPFAVFFLLGVSLIVTTVKKKVKGKLKKFLILTGASAAGFFVSVLLHNFLYALGVLAKDIKVLHYLFEFLHAAFFIIAIFICPIGFLIGIAGSIILLIFKVHPSRTQTSRIHSQKISEFSS